MQGCAGSEELAGALEGEKRGEIWGPPYAREGLLEATPVLDRLAQLEGSRYNQEVWMLVVATSLQNPAVAAAPQQRDASTQTEGALLRDRGTQKKEEEGLDEFKPTGGTSTKVLSCHRITVFFYLKLLLALYRFHNNTEKVSLFSFSSEAL
ncbi:hypothetical protein Esti_000921 [Eimeria stiedai]